mmetsp:Transcript_112992/g.300169  ORF Transcript_112992/g.300169 Transcript_112992/m.300169 type:complete len:236 (+) Transcript_112992:423-1130(+)
MRSRSLRVRRSSFSKRPCSSRNSACVARQEATSWGLVMGVANLIESFVRAIGDGVADARDGVSLLESLLESWRIVKSTTITGCCSSIGLTSTDLMSSGGCPKYCWRSSSRCRKSLFVSSRLLRVARSSASKSACTARSSSFSLARRSALMFALSRSTSRCLSRPSSVRASSESPSRAALCRPVPGSAKPAQFASNWRWMEASSSDTVARCSRAAISALLPSAPSSSSRSSASAMP